MYDYILHKRSISDINLKHFEDAIEASINCGITTTAPLGYSGNDILLFGSVAGGRSSVVSVRNHSGSIELLITDKTGHFIFLGKYSPKLGYPFIAMQFMEVFDLVKNFIEISI